MTIAIAALAFLLLGCGGDDGGNGDSREAAEQEEAATSSSTGQGEGPFNDADVAFAQQMVVHHQTAIEMAEMAELYSETEVIMALAARVKAAQGPEIAELTTMLENWGETPAGGDHEMGGMGGSSGMTEQQMTSLEQARGDAFDRMFLELMIPHHRSAIEMSKTEVAQGENVDAKAMAQKIIDDQTNEIAEMQQMLGNL